MRKAFLIIIIFGGLSTIVGLQGLINVIVELTGPSAGAAGPGGVSPWLLLITAFFLLLGFTLIRFGVKRLRVR